MRWRTMMLALKAASTVAAPRAAVDSDLGVSWLRKRFRGGELITASNSTTVRSSEFYKVRTAARDKHRCGCHGAHIDPNGKVPPLD